MAGTGSEPPAADPAPGSDTSAADPAAGSDPLRNLSLLGQRVDSLRRFLSDSIDRHVSVPPTHLSAISSDLHSALRLAISNAAALIQTLPAPPPRSTAEADPEILEISAEELVAEHVHFCEVCGKGFRRDANLRMHMRAHGGRFKAPEALSGPAQGRPAPRPVRFSCPVQGCGRNRAHPRFRPLKSAVCARNHYRRAHCPKVYTCHKCGEKSFAVVGDLRAHLRQCGEGRRWRCTCGTRFSRKDKLFGHVALFEGHAPAVGVEEEQRAEGGEAAAAAEEDGDGLDSEFFEGLMEEFRTFDGTYGNGPL